MFQHVGAVQVGAPHPTDLQGIHVEVGVGALDSVDLADGVQVAESVVVVVPAPRLDPDIDLGGSFCRQEVDIGIDEEYITT